VSRARGGSRPPGEPEEPGVSSPRARERGGGAGVLPGCGGISDAVGTVPGCRWFPEHGLGPRRALLQCGDSPPWPRVGEGLRLETLGRQPGRGPRRGMRGHAHAETNAASRPAGGGQVGHHRPSPLRAEGGEAQPLFAGAVLRRLGTLIFKN
jgi:hypothetical protein